MIYLTDFIYVDMSSTWEGTVDKLTASTESNPSKNDGFNLAPTRTHWGANLVDNGGGPIPSGYRPLPTPKWSG